MIDSYIIQIYRRNRERREMTGTIEKVGPGVRQRFSSLEELWDHLNAKPARHRRLPGGSDQSDPQS